MKYALAIIVVAGLCAAVPASAEEVGVGVGVGPGGAGVTVGADHRDRDRERTTVIKEREPRDTTVIKEREREPDRKVIIVDFDHGGFSFVDVIGATFQSGFADASLSNDVTAAAITVLRRASSWPVRTPAANARRERSSFVLGAGSVAISAVKCSSTLMSLRSPMQSCTSASTERNVLRSLDAFLPENTASKNWAALRSFLAWMRSLCRLCGSSFVSSRPLLLFFPAAA